MDLYSRKQRWKLILLVFALVIVGTSLWFSQRIVEQIRKDERLRIKIWSEAVKSSVDQLYVTSRLFDRLREEERKKVKLWARATQELGKDLTDYTFAIDVVQQNKSVPVILTDAAGNYSSSLNLDISRESIADQLKLTQPDRDDSYYRLESSRIFKDTLQKMMLEWKEVYPPIEILYKGKPVNYVYYRESNLIAELEAKKDSLTRSFRKELVENQALVPVVFTDSSRSVVIESNFDSLEINTPGKLQQLISEMSKQNEPIRVRLGDGNIGYIFYQDSEVLTQLRYFPYIQLVIVFFFILIGYLIFSTFRRAEQNQVWAGMAKETAHQLGTPLSSLIGWIEVLRSQGVDPISLDEMNKDIDRLQVVTDRFSKIGSPGQLEERSFNSVVEKSFHYLRPRLSRNVKMEIKTGDDGKVQINENLFSWVIENLIKNAVDAMEGKGSLVVRTGCEEKMCWMEVEDTGKGIPSSQLKSVFQPGFTTKKRGWGLGLALSRRIINEYHKGKVFIVRSEPGVGTTFRVELPLKEY